MENTLTLPCIRRVNIGAIFEAGSMADLAPLSDLVSLLYTVRVEDLKPLQRRSTFTGGQNTTPGSILSIYLSMGNLSSNYAWATCG